MDKNTTVYSLGLCLSVGQLIQLYCMLLNLPKVIMLMKSG